MLKSQTIIRWTRAWFALAAFATLSPVYANQVQTETTQPHQIDVVIALDVSTSMNGLIGSAKQRLWDIVNELGRAQPQPELRMAILSYGNPEYGSQSGFVRIDLPFTSDLDAVSKTLFGFSTNGGDEYVARVVNTAVNDLEWSDNPHALRVLFVAGNEGAHQDPQIPALLATQAAASKGIIVNTIYCGGDNDGDAIGWREVAAATNGMYASINQDIAAVANIPTPMDQEIAALNKKLNDTYVAYGKDGEEYRSNQIEQDKNVAALSAPAMASRTEAKVSALYHSGSWDLVDAVNSGAALEDIEPENLPTEMQEMEVEERVAYVGEKAKAREEVQGRIQALADERRDYIENERARQADSDEKGLDEVIQLGLQSLAEEKGFTFD